MSNTDFVNGLLNVVLFSGGVMVFLTCLGWILSKIFPNIFGRNDDDF